MNGRVTVLVLYFFLQRISFWLASSSLFLSLCHGVIYVNEILWVLKSCWIAIRSGTICSRRRMQFCRSGDKAEFASLRRDVVTQRKRSRGLFFLAENEIAKFFGRERLMGCFEGCFICMMINILHLLLRDVTIHLYYVFTEPYQYTKYTTHKQHFGVDLFNFFLWNLYFVVVYRLQSTHGYQYSDYDNGWSCRQAEDLVYTNKVEDRQPCDFLYVVHKRRCKKLK